MTPAVVRAIGKDTQKPLEGYAEFSLDGLDGIFNRVCPTPVSYGKYNIRSITPRHNGKVERQNKLNEERFYNDLRMYSLTDGNKQLEKYQKKSNAIWKVCLGM